MWAVNMLYAHIKKSPFSRLALVPGFSIPVPRVFMPHLAWSFTCKLSRVKVLSGSTQFTGTPAFELGNGNEEHSPAQKGSPLGTLFIFL